MVARGATAFLAHPTNLSSPHEPSRAGFRVMLLAVTCLVYRLATSAVAEKLNRSHQGDPPSTFRQQWVGCLAYPTPTTKSGMLHERRSISSSSSYAANLNSCNIRGRTILAGGCKPHRGGGVYSVTQPAACHVALEAEHRGRGPTTHEAIRDSPAAPPRCRRYQTCST
ncbi:hypothetical protein EDB87DRAFT_381410 [Lactarius vividus]|nr:hypothetical protein EDB87DRAFT_381410 [Lactarius vividus]